MADRRSFIKKTALGAAIGPSILSGCASGQAQGPAVLPAVISTWDFGLEANDAAWEVLAAGGAALDAVEAGVRVTEADPTNMTVGIGGHADRDGNVTLDASIMGADGRCGSVACLEEIQHPISVARKVMEETPHVMLAGQGAQDFAVDQGFERKDLMTAQSREAWERWKAGARAERPPINIENHDTIGMLALDSSGRLAGACTTSGAAYKYAGRIGDSPIIGAGLYVDGAVGAATATGWGEAVIRAVGSFLVVEFMRQGHGPSDACRLAVERVVEKNPDWREIQVGFIALNTRGEFGGYCIHPNFTYAVRREGEANRTEAPPSRV